MIACGLAEAVTNENEYGLIVWRHKRHSKMFIVAWEA